MNLQETFNRQGYLNLPELMSAASCDALMQRGLELASGADLQEHPSIFETTNQTASSDAYFLDSGDKISFFFEKDAFDTGGKLKTDLFHSLNKIGHAMHDLDPVFMEFSRAPQLKKLAHDLGMQNHVLIQSMLIFKHARIGGAVDVHQDSTFLHTQPLSCVGFWFALEDATIANGCLWAKPGGHQTSLRSWFKRKEGGGTEMVTFDPEELSMEGMIPLEVKKGSCIVLHGSLPHYSLPNTSGKSRQAYAIHTIDPRAEYPLENWLRRDMQSLRPF